MGVHHFQRCLGLYHYLVLFHQGQSSREYSALCKLMKRFTPKGSHQSVNCLLSEDNTIARDLFERLGGKEAKEELVEWKLLDYEACGDCNFDHSYEYEKAHKWHTENPGSYD